MRIPLYFLDKNDILIIQEIYDIYISMSKDKDALLLNKEKKDIIDTLNKRVYLDSKKLIRAISVLCPCITGLETVGITTYTPTSDMKLTLLKLLSVHKDILTDDDYVDNFTIFKYIAKLFLTIPEEKLQNKAELYTYNFVILLNI